MGGCASVQLVLLTGIECELGLTEQWWAQIDIVPAIGDESIPGSV